VATAGLLLVAGAACASDTTDPPAVTPPEPSTASTTQPSSSPPAPVSDSEAAATSASSLVREYFAVVDRARQQPDSPLSSLRTVATSAELTAQQVLLRSERRRGYRQLGDTRLDDVQVQSVNLDNSDPGAGRVPSVDIDVCVNVAAVDIVDARGESVVASSRPDSGSLRLTVANYRWSRSPDIGWRVVSSRDLEQASCAAS
jgi:hypothetical protein